MKPRWWLVVDSIILLLLLTVAGVWFLYNHAHGAWGDDAPGYIYAASELYRGQALVKQDALVQDALAWFSNEAWSRWVAPAHHEIISPAGWTVSRYPLGLSVLMAVAAWLTGSSQGFYLVVPVLALVVVAATYVGAILLLPLTPPLKRVAAIGAAMIVLCSDLFGNSAMAQPMREIPSMALILVAVLGWWQALRVKRPRLRAALYVITGLLFAYSVGIRETSSIVLPVFVLLAWPKRQQLNWKQVILWCGLGAVLAYSFFAYQAVQTTLHKEKFRNKDVSSLAITANFDHIQSLSPANLFNNQGKFKPGVGGLQQYWEVANEFNAWPLFMITVIVGLITLSKRDRALTVTLGSWIAFVVVLFGMWINPYGRYILPILPVLAWCSLFGLISGAQWLAQALRLTPRWGTLFMAMGAVSFAMAQLPAIEWRQASAISPLATDRAINQADADVLQQLASNLQQDSVNHKPALLLMLGSMKGGLSETIMAHTNLRVIRYPSKPKEQPPYDQLVGYLQHLQEDYTLYVWYDASVSAGEQRLYGELARVLVASYNLSMQSGITIERIE